jgi:RNA polymerase sigma factor (sigma-70 family)
MLKKQIEEAVYQAILNGEEDKVLDYLYTYINPKVVQFVCANSGTTEEAHDIFQDAVLIFCKEVKIKRFKPEHGVGAFIFTVCRNLWINKAKRKYRHYESLNNDYKFESSSNVEGEFISEERSKILRDLLDQLGERCKELLIYSAYHGLSMRQIAEKMNFASENAAKTRHYKCKQKLLKIVEENPQLRESLKS